MKHEIYIVPAHHYGHLDAGDLMVATCSCGLYRSAPCTEATAKKRGAAHVAAKEGHR